MEKPLLSIIIPVFNAESFLPTCLDSIIAAEISNLEILLIDDGSNDESLKICRQYSERHSYIRTIEQQNAGPSVARNKGLDCAAGEYIAFIDADDYLAPKSFAHHVSLLSEHKPDMWASDFKRVADNGCVLDEVFQITQTDVPISSKEFITQFLAAKDCVWNVWRYIFRREFLEQKKLCFAEGFNIAEDLEFVVRAISACGNFVFLHEPYYFYRVNYGASLTRRYTLQRVEQLMAMLKKAAQNAGAGECAQLLRAKLGREYILNLSILYEVPREDRSSALAALKDASSLMGYAGGIYRIVAKVIVLLGIPFSAWILYLMKRIKRLKRTLKTKAFSKEKA